MTSEQRVSLSKEEALALLEMIDMLSGGNLDNVFSPDNEKPDISEIAFGKLFLCAGWTNRIPKHVLAACP